jgi:hypothetical protein
MAARQIKTGLNGEGADCLFGTPMPDVIRRAQAIESYVPTHGLRLLLGKLAQTAGSPYWRQAFELSTGLNRLDDWAHPVNLGSVWTNLRAVEQCFGKSAIDEAFAQRQSLLGQYKVANDPLNEYHEQTMLGEVVDSATLWTGVFHEQGVDMIRTKPASRRSIPIQRTKESVEGRVAAIHATRHGIPSETGIRTAYLSMDEAWRTIA